MYFVCCLVLLKLLLSASPGVAKNATWLLEETRREVLSELLTAHPQIALNRKLFTEKEARIIGGKEVSEGAHFIILHGILNFATFFIEQQEKIENFDFSSVALFAC